MARPRTGSWAFWIIGNLVAYMIVLSRGEFSSVSCVVVVNCMASIALDPDLGFPLGSRRAVSRTAVIAIVVCVASFLVVQTEMFTLVYREKWFLILVSLIITGTSAFHILWKRNKRIAASTAVLGGKRFTAR